MKIARRLQGISASPTMAGMQQAQELKAQGIDVIDFGPGEPDFPTPEGIKRAGIQAIEKNFTRYTPSAGIKELRQAVAEKLNRQWDTGFTAANVVITCGAKHAIYDLCMAVFEEGDEVLNPTPYWVTFPEVIKMTGARPVDVLTPEEGGFILEPDAVRGRLSGATRGLIMSTPNNPTGAVVPPTTLQELTRLARERDLFIVFDETYEYFTYENHRHTSMAAYVKPDEEFYAIVGCVSKTYSMTGWRIGYLATNRELAGKISEFQSHQTGNPVSISQKAALTALSSGTEEIQAMLREYEKRRAFVVPALNQIPGFRCAPPQGAFYAFPNVSRCMEAAGMATSEELARYLIQKARVATVPGSAFGLEGYIRLSYATSLEKLKEGLDRIRTAVS